MTVLSRGARVRRGGRRPGWVLLTTLLVLAIGASSALVFTNRVELLKLAVILALWAAVAGAFVSVQYRRQVDADQARVRDLKLVYDLQLDREISARREYELTVESQLRRELASELRGAAADEVAALRAELSALRTSLEILFDADLEHRPALETVGKEASTARALTDRAQNDESPSADWVSSDRVRAVRQREAAGRTEEVAIIDVPEEPLLPPRQPAAAREHSRERPRLHYEAPPAQPDPLFEPRHRTPPAPPAAPPPQTPLPQPEPSAWQPVGFDGQWLPPGAPGSHWASADSVTAPPAPPSGRRQGARHSSPEDQESPLGHVEVARGYGGRRSRSRHSAEYRDYGIGSSEGNQGDPGLGQPPQPPPPAAPPPRPAPAPSPPPPRLAPPPSPEPAPRHRSAEPGPVGPAEPASHDGSASETGGQSVADLLARLQVEPTGGGRRRRRGG